MENFDKRLFDLREECKQYIKSRMEKLADDNGQYYLVDQQVVEDMDTDVLLECPVTDMEGRHGHMYHYYIYKLETDSVGDIWFHGIDIDISDDYVFSAGELTSECLADIATNLQLLND